jgi:hypothetical protein
VQLPCVRLKLIVRVENIAKASILPGVYVQFMIKLLLLWSGTALIIIPGIGLESKALKLVDTYVAYGWKNVSF